MNSPIHTDTNAQTPAQRQTMSRSSFYLVLFLLSLLFINFSDDETQDGKKPTVEDILLELRHERESLGNVTYAVNVTHPLSDSMQKTLASVAAIGHGTAPLFYQNITGVFRGEWKSQNETLPPSDTTYNQTLEEINRGEFKFTGLGSYTLNLKSIKTEDEHVHYIEASTLPL
ncbi:hypothetical protein BDF14DRAFT_667609 [Spinellus fusiger]|nr:hypothetical protein BDF14DRAFT_667609 [Spinellus fusiger]